MAQRITRLVFLAGGVVFPDLAETAASLLASGRQLALPQRLGMQEAARSLTAEQAEPRQFCARAAGICAEPSDLAASLLCERLAEGLDPLPGMPSLIAEVAPTLEVRLVSDYPAIWLLPSLARSELARHFPAAEVSYVADLGGYAGMFDALVAARVILPGHTIWVDSHSPRTSEALRKGIDANIFVDARRLRRDLSLWRLVPIRFS